MDGDVEEPVGLDVDPLLLDDDDDVGSVGMEGVSIVRDDDCDTPGVGAADPEMVELQPTITSIVATAPASAPRLIARR